MDELELLDKQLEVLDLYLRAELVPFDRYFDLDSTELLDEKIRVLSERIDGKTIGEIEGFYDILELLPKEGFWD